jgi:ribonuclease P protein component
MKANRFPKSSRLRGQKKIQELFKRGSSFYFNAFRMVVLKSPSQHGKHEVVFTVSKRNFKKAVNRNRIKRLLKEAYRLNQQKISSLPKLQMAYIYTSNELPDFRQMEEQLLESFERLKHYVGKT